MIIVNSLTSYEDHRLQLIQDKEVMTFLKLFHFVVNFITKQEFVGLYFQFG